MSKEQAILDALRQIVDPDLGRDIVTLGFVKDLHIEKSRVRFTLELTTPACPVKESFKQQAEELVKLIPGIEEVTVTLSGPRSRKVFDPERMKSGAKDVGCLVAISSCKGGVGKSTLAASIAMEIASRGQRVGLLDADLFGPSVPTLFDLHDVDMKVTAENKMIPISKGRLKLISFGFLIKEAPAVLRGPMASNYLKQLIHQSAWGELDYLFIDMPPGTGDIPLTLTQTLELDGAVIVTTPHSLSLADVGKGILMFEKVNVPVLGIIENMSYFLCPDNGKAYHLFGRDATRKVQERFGAEILGNLPLFQDFDLTGSRKGIAGEMLSKTVDQVVRAIGKSALSRKENPRISFDDQWSRVTWNDGSTTQTLHVDLRYYCNSASNVDERTGQRLIKRENIPPDIKPRSASPLGNYAFAIEWSDGHRSIFPYDYFKEIAAKAK